MEFIRKMFAEKTLSFYEDINRVLQFMMKIPGFGKYFEGRTFSNSHSKARMLFGIFAFIWQFFLQFVKKYIYVAVFMYVPYMLIAYFCPIIRNNQEDTMLFLFFVLTTVCGSIANNTIFAMGDRDYLMVRVVMVSPYMNFLGRLVRKMFMDFIYFTIILSLFGVSILPAFMVSVVTLLARPIGEMIGIICFEHFPSLYTGRNAYNGAVIAVCVLLAYGMPVLNRSVHSSWLFFVHPVFVVAMIFAGVLALYYLWSYKDYRKIMREAVYIKREV